ncbi:hypothetical protein AHAS_Ahas07G0137200 [Arachis hypogaea]
MASRIGSRLIKRILVDTGADFNILFKNAFDALGPHDSDLHTHQNGEVGIGDFFIKPNGVVKLPISVGNEVNRRTIMADFVVFKDHTAYNVILGRKTLNDFYMVVFTRYLTMKFWADDSTIGTIYGNLERQ